MINLSGTWSGRLIDVAGFEATVGLTLTGRGEKRAGTFTAVIATQHTGKQISGPVVATVTDNKVEMVVTIDKAEIKVAVTGDVFTCKDGALGIKGIYEVAGRGHSALAGGVTCLTRPRALRKGELPAGTSQATIGKR